MERYWFNIHALPVLLTGIMMLASGVFVLLKHPRAAVNRSFFLICLSVTAWLIPTGLGYLSKHPDQAQVWFKWDNFGVMFISVAVFHFVSSFLRLERRVAVCIGYLVALLFGLVVIFTDWLVVGVHKYSWGYFPKWGLFSIVFFTIFFGYMAASFQSLWSEYRKVLEPARKNQIKYLFLAFALAYTGSVDYLPAFGIPVYPFGFVAIFIFLSVVALTIVKYRLMDITLAMTRGTIFALVYAVVLGVPLLLALSFEVQLEQWLGTRWWISLWVACSILATAAHYANQYIQKKAEARLRAEELEAHRKLRQLSQDMLRFTELQPLLDQIVHQVVKILKVAHAAVYLADPEDGSCKRQSAWGPQVKKSSLPEAIAEDSPFIRDLATTRLPRVREELKLQQQVASPEWRKLESTMDQLQASVVIPAFKPERFFGFLALGDKRSGRIWTQDDLNMLTLLANQAALAIENVQLHEAQAERMIKEAVDQSTIEIARGVGHQFNNSLNDIKLLGEILLHTLKTKPLESLSPGDILAFAHRMVKTISGMVNEATTAGGIATGVLNLTKPMPLELHPVDIKPLLEDTITRVLRKHAVEKVENELVTPAILNGVPKTLRKVPGTKAQIEQVFYNILDNAVDAIREKMFQLHKGWLPAPPEGPYKGRVQVKAQESGGRLTITIEDDGIGIAPENMKRLFAPFFTTKGQSKGRGLGGHGAGLVVIKRIIEAHGGKIRVASEPAQWTRFTIDLPVEKESHGA